MASTSLHLASRTVFPSRAHAHRGTGRESESVQRNLGKDTARGPGRHDVVHGRRGESRRARAPGDLSIRGAQRVVDHPLALQQTSAAAATAEEDERRRRRRRRRRSDGGGGGGGRGGGGGIGGRQQQSRDSSVEKSVLVRQSG